jgi:L-aspartate oxidase
VVRVPDCSTRRASLLWSATTRWGDLAPRDIVSRAIVAELRRTESGPAYLDMTHLDADRIPKRFPRIYETCLLYGIDIALKLVPVHPAAHYAMGGVHADLDGRTTVTRLYAAGETACTGVHGRKPSRE